MPSLQKQKGMSLLGTAFLIFLVVFFGMLFVKLSGSYYDHMTVNKMIVVAIEGNNGSRFDDRDFSERLSKNLSINNIQLNLKESLTVNKTKKPNVLELEYEKRVHLFSNVDVVMSFNEEYEL